MIQHIGKRLGRRQGAVGGVTAVIEVGGGPGVCAESSCRAVLCVQPVASSTTAVAAVPSVTQTLPDMRGTLSYGLPSRLRCKSHRGPR